MTQEPTTSTPFPMRCRQLDILHTTLARLLKPPKGHGKAVARRLDAAMRSLTQELCGLETTLRELWYIQERHLLALALNGKFDKERAPLQCQRSLPQP